MKLLLAILPTVVLTLYSQLVSKWRVGELAANLQDAGVLRRVLAYLSDPFILSAYALTLLASLSWFVVLERFALSIAYPVFIGVMFAAVTLGGMLLFGEPYKANRLLAVLLIFAGIVLGALES